MATMVGLAKILPIEVESEVGQRQLGTVGQLEVLSTSN